MNRIDKGCRSSSRWVRQGLEDPGPRVEHPAAAHHQSSTATPFVFSLTEAAKDWLLHEGRT